MIGNRSKHGYAIFPILLMAFFFLFVFYPALARASNEPQVNTKTTTIKHHLSYFLGGQQQEILHFTDAKLTIPIAVPMDEQVDTAQLHLQITPSAALNDQSWLVIIVNNQVVKQVSMAGKQGFINSEFSLPKKLFHAGYNSLELKAIQHYTWRCEYPMAEQLWSQINLSESTLRISLSPKTWNPSLAELNDIFNPSNLADHARLYLFIPKTSNKIRTLSAAALAVQGVALRYQYLPLQIVADSLNIQNVQQWLNHPVDLMETAIFIGNQKELKPIFTSAKMLPIKSGLIILRWSDHPLHTALAFVGNDSNLLMLARAFAEPAINWPPTQDVNIESLKLPKLNTLLPPQKVIPFSESAYEFQSLGFNTQTRKGYDPVPMALRIWDGYWQSKAQLRLHLAYAAGMAAQSALNVSINGIQQASIPLNNPAGGRFADYTVTIPPTMLHPGWNNVSLEPVLIPQSNGGECRPFFLGNLWVTVYGDSTFQWMGEIIKTIQPDFRPLADAAFPFFKDVWNNKLDIQISSSTQTEISAALTLLGKLAQVAGHPMLQVNFISDSEPLSTSDIYVGPLAGASAWKNIPGGRDSLHIEQVPIAYVKPSFSISEFFGKRILSKTATATVSWNNKPDNLVFLHIWRDGSHDHLFFTTENVQNLAKAADQLISCGSWAQLHGYLVWWKIGEKKLQCMGLTEVPFRNYGIRGGLSIWISRHPFWGFLILLAIGLFFVLATRYVLKIYAKHKKRGNN